MKKGYSLYRYDKKFSSMLQNRFKKILVGMDGSANSIRALNEGISLARQCEGSITGIHVLTLPYGLNAKQLMLLKNQMRQNTIKFFNKAQLSAARNGINFTGKIVTSKYPIDVLTGFAKKNKFNVIIIGSRGTGSSTKQYVGSFARGVINNSHTPVLVVK